VEIVSNNFDLARQTIDIGRCVRDDKNRTIWKFALADRRSQAFDPIGAPNEENDCATVLHDPSIIHPPAIDSKPWYR
jgi:hypothetical protein